MKKVLLAIVLATLSLGLHAQIGKGEKSVILQAGYQSDPGRLMLGVAGRYAIVDNIRLAPDVMFMFPKDKVTGLDVNINAHYVFSVEDKLNIFPLMGLAMLNNRYSGGERIGDYKTKSKGFTDWGFNLGGGLEYNISSYSFLNLEMKYTFSDADHFTVGFGYGFKF